MSQYLRNQMMLEVEQGYSRKDGFKYDNGPTFFHYPEIAEEIFEALGLDAREELGLIELNPNYRLVFGAGGSINASTDLEDMVSQIGELCGEDNANGFRRYIEDNRTKLKLSKNCLNSPWSGPTDLLSRRALRVAKVLRPWRSVSSDLSKMFTDERMQLAMSFQTKYLGMSPFHPVFSQSWHISSMSMEYSMSREDLEQ